MDRQSIIDKIKSLRKLEERASTKGEAEAAAYAIAGIIDRYKLAVSELEDDPGEEQKGKIERLDLDEGFKRLAAYKRVLLNAIARHCGVSIIMTTKDRKKVRTLVGFSSDVEFTRHMYSWLVLEASDMSPKGHGKGYSQSWCLGFARGIAIQLAKARAAVLESMPENKCAAIVLDKSPAVDEFVNKLFPDIRTVQYKSYVSNEFAYLDGKLQGENTHLGNRLRGESS